MTRVALEALPYQSEIVQVRNEPLPWFLKVWPATGAISLGALVALAALLPIDVVVSARGRIISNEPPAILRPVAAAVLHNLYVQPGDMVEEGQLLARLDQGVPRTNQAVLEAERAALAAEVARIEAHLSGEPLVGIGSDLDLQRRVGAEQSAMEAAQRESLTADVARLDGEISSAILAEPAYQEQLAAARELENMRSTLLSDQNGTRGSYIEARLARLTVEAQIRAQQTRLAALRSEREAAVARLSAFESDVRQRRLERLTELQPRLRALDEQLAQVADFSRMYDITAPNAGMVLSVAPGGPGSMITTADAVVVIAQIEGPMRVQIALGSDDVGRVHPGDPVEVKVDAFPWRRHGVLTGRLTDIAPNSATPSTGGEAVHIAHVQLDSDQPALLGMMPGMTLSSDISIGTSTILHFLLGPLLDGLSESLREPRS